MKPRLRRALLILYALVLVVSGGYIAWKYYDYFTSEADYRAAAEAAGASMPPVAPSAQPDPADPLASEPPDPVVEVMARVDLAALRETNQEVVGWISIPGTALSYPFLFHGDNQYYLNHTWSGQRNSAGAIFLEQECAADFTDFNTILYGHRMNNDTMFGSLGFYDDLEFWRSHPSVYVTTDAGVARYDIFAAGEVSVQDAVYSLHVDGAERRQQVIDAALNASVLDTGVVPTPEDRLLTLSTCTGPGYSPNRWVVLARLAREYPAQGQAG